MRVVGAKTAVARAVYTALAASCRFSWVEGGDAIERLWRESGAAILCLWHSRILGCTRFIDLELARRSFPVHAMVSRSEDGELIARLIESLGGETARGSSSRGGSAALRQLARSLRRPPGVAVTTPDGPLGPARQVQPGTVLLAQLSGVPILPMSYAASRSWRLSSWDRFVVPQPFSRLAVAIGRELRVEPDTDEAGRERLRQELEEALLRADRRAAQLVASG